MTISEGIISNAEIIAAKGVKPFDALHAACAISAGCQYFLTTDDSLLKRLAGFDKVKAINPVEYLRLLEVPDENG